jgi:SAM-dependent methyltransferase
MVKVKRLLQETLSLAKRSHLYTAKARRLAIAKRFVPRLSGWVIDIGSKGQPYRPYLPKCVTYTALEYAPEPGSHVRGDVLRLPFVDGAFDGAILTEVLEHVVDPSCALRDVHRALRPGGQVYATVPMTWGLHCEPHDYFRFTNYGLSHLMRSAGFEVREMARIGGLFSSMLARLEEMGVTLLYRLAFPLKPLIGSAGRVLVVSLVVFPGVVVLDAVARVLDLVVPGSDKDPLGWAVQAVKRSTARG